MASAKPESEPGNQKGNTARRSKPIQRSTQKPSSAPPLKVQSRKNVISRHKKNSPEANTSQVVKDLTMNFDISVKDIAGVLDVTPKTFSRWKGKENAMSEQQADRMLILKSIFDLGRKVLGSDENVKKWIRESVFSLNGETPLRLLKTESGRRRVESALHQIEYGFF